MTPQAHAVLDRLRQGSLTTPEAIRRGCYRLAARIYELRRAGYRIQTTRERGLGRYRLSK